MHVRHRFATVSAIVAVLACATAVQGAGELWLTLPPTPTLPEADASGTLALNGIQIWHALFSTHLASAGPTVVFLHGGLGHSAYMGLQVAEVAKYRQVLSIDSRGHGRSSRDAEPYSYELMESDVIAVMDHLGLQHVDIVGWSDGGIIGLVMARDHPSRLHSLFSFAPNSDPSGVLDVSASPVFNEYVERAGQEYLLISPTPTQVAYDYFVANISNMWATQPSFTAPTFAAMTSNNTNPILIVDGDHEEAIKRVDTLFIADSNVNFGLVLLPRVSHFAFIQDPLTFNNAIFSWLKIAQVGTPSAPAAPTSSASVPSISLFLVALIASFAAMF